MHLRRQHRPAGLLGADDKGDWTGFDVDFCRAIAAAIFNDPSKVKFVPLDASERFKELRQAQDRRAVAQLDLDACRAKPNYGLHFAGVSYYDGQGFMVPQVAQRRLRRSSSTAARSACRADTTTELNLADYFRANNMKYEEMKFDSARTRCCKAYDPGNATC